MIENCMDQNHTDTMNFPFSYAGIYAAEAVEYLDKMPMNGEYLNALLDFIALWQGR